MNINPYASYDPTLLKPRLAKDILPVVPASELPELPKFSPEEFYVTEAERAVQKAANSPENLYAEVKVNGETVATVWKTGVMMLPNKYSDISAQASKYNTAQERVDFLVKALGAEVSYYNKQNTSPSYSFSDSLAKILASSYK